MESINRVCLSITSKENAKDLGFNIEDEEDISLTINSQNVPNENNFD